MSEKREIFLSHIACVLPAFGALIIALYVKSAYTILTSIYTFYAAGAALPALAALYWKRATAPGVITSMLGGFADCVVWKVLGSPMGISATIAGLVVCLILLVTVSLLTCRKHLSKPV